MSEITGIFYIFNGELKSNSEFDDSFLSKPHYIYEIFRTVDGIPLFVEDHIERFEHSLRLSNIVMPFSKKEILRQIDILIYENNLKTGNIKMVFLPYNATEGFRHMIYITPHDYPTKDQYRYGVPVSFYNGTRIQPNAKIMDSALRLGTDRSRIEENVYEALLVDPDGFITEGSRSNIFFIKNDDKLITPPIDYILPGITRKHIIALCHEMNIDIKEEIVHKEDINEMKGVFVSGTSRKVLPVNRVDKYTFPVDHPLLLKIKDAFNKKIEDYLAGQKSEY